MTTAHAYSRESHGNWPNRQGQSVVQHSRWDSIRWDLATEVSISKRALWKKFLPFIRAAIYASNGRSSPAFQFLGSAGIWKSGHRHVPPAKVSCLFWDRLCRGAAACAQLHYHPIPALPQLLQRLRKTAVLMIIFTNYSGAI